MQDSKRDFIISTFAAWTALSALRSGSPVKSRQEVYSLVGIIPFEQILTGVDTIDENEFNEWHQKACAALCKQNSRLCTGWAAKIINVYLKTATYIGDLGRPGLRNVIHPPVDGGLWQGIEKKFQLTDPEITELTHTVKSIKAITNYSIYARIISGCRLASKELNCSLIEIEQLWDTMPKVS